MKTKFYSVMAFIENKRYSLMKKRLFSDRRGFGMNELLSIAAALILAAFIVIPQLKTFAQTVMSGLSEWWRDTIKTSIFPSSL